MKQTIRIIGASALVALLFLAGCSEPIDLIKPVKNGANGSVQVQIGPEVGARTLVPSTDQFDGYRLDFTKNDSTTTKITVDLTGEETTKDVELESGYWQVKATGLVDGKDSVYGTDTVFITAGKNHKVNIILTDSVLDVPGVFSYSIEFPALDGNYFVYDSYTSATLVISPINGTNSGTVTIDMKEKNYSDRIQTVEVDGYASYYFLKEDLELPPGQYEMTLSLVSNRAINTGGDLRRLGAYRKEVVYIYSNMVTSTPEYKFKENDFTAELYIWGQARINSQPASRNYKPVEVQVSWSNGTGGSYPEDSLIDIIDGICEVDSVDSNIYNWEMFIDTNAISYYTVNTNNTLYYRFKAVDGDRVVYSAWQGYNFGTDIHGRPYFNAVWLSADIYSVDMSTASYPAETTIETGIYTSIYGVNPPATTDFAAGSRVLLTITPPAGYGVIRDTFSAGSYYEEASTTNFLSTTFRSLDLNIQDSAVYDFTMPSSQWFGTPYFESFAPSAIIQNLDFYTLSGTFVVGGVNEKAFKPTSITVYDIPSDTEIGTSALTLNTTSSLYEWNISTLPEWFKLTTSGKNVRVNVTLTTTESVPLGLETLSYDYYYTIWDFTGTGPDEVIADPAAALPAPSTLSLQGLGTSIRVIWDSVPNAQGYNIYRDGSITPLNGSLITGTSYTDSTVTAVSPSYTYTVATVNDFDVVGSVSGGVAGTSVDNNPSYDLRYGPGIAVQTPTEINIAWNGYPIISTIRDASDDSFIVVEFDGATSTSTQFAEFATYFYNPITTNYEPAKYEIALADVVNNRVVVTLGAIKAGMAAYAAENYPTVVYPGLANGGFQLQMVTADTTNELDSVMLYEKPIELSSYTWTNGNISGAGEYRYYTFYANAYTTYYVQWDDSYQGSGMTTLDIDVSATWAASGVSIFSSIDSAYFTPQNFTPTNSGYVLLRVRAYGGGNNIGTFRIMYQN
ncbi:MAG: hypothetical protein LBI04_06535 [Treponema sp.]|jgi:hypothetical protein|nr:hypothetical protein [Treponema sp.]